MATDFCFGSGTGLAMELPELFVRAKEGDIVLPLASGLVGSGLGLLTLSLVSDAIARWPNPNCWWALILNHTICSTIVRIEAQNNKFEVSKIKLELYLCWDGKIGGGG